MDKKLIILVCLVLISSLTVTSALAQKPEPPDTNGEDLPDHVPGEVLIRFYPWINSAQASLQMEQLDLKLKREIPVLDVKLVKLPPGLSVEEAISRINQRPGVEYVEPNYILQVAAETPVEIADQWGLSQIRAIDAWSTFPEPVTKEILLATVDTGIDQFQPDLAENMWNNPGETGTDGNGNDKTTNGIDDDANGLVDDWWGWDFVNNDNDPDDDNMHGTAVSSVMAGNKNGQGVAGVCPWCKVMSVKVMGANGTGTLDVVASGITYAAENGAQAINLSLTGPAGSLTLENAVNYAWNAGALVVAAAGNNGLNTIMYPAGYDKAMGVGSTNLSDSRSCFSNYAENYISVAAPGEAILVADINNTETGYGYYSGTSLSAPHVAGLAGLLLSQEPTPDKNQLRSQIENTAVDLGLLDFDPVYGYGRIDAYRAVTNDDSPVLPTQDLFSFSNSASGYAHARKLVRDTSGENDILHMIWHTQEGALYRIRHATSVDNGANWTPQSDVYNSPLETYHPALAADNQFLYVAIPRRSAPGAPYQIIFTRKTLTGGSWSTADTLMGGTYDAVRPDLYFDPTNDKLHLIASSLDNAPVVYYQASEDRGITWNSSVAEINPSTGTTGANSSTRYATIHASGNNIYIAARTVNTSFFTYYYLHTVRSTNGGQTWFDQTKISSYLAILTGEYGVSLAGVSNRVYMGYEVQGNIYFRYHDGATWSDFETLQLGDADNVYKWPTITQAEDGQAWMIFELNGELFMRHYDGSTWAPKESVGAGSYANLKLGTNGDKLEWTATQCSGAPFLVSYDSRTLGANNPPQANSQLVVTDEDTPVAVTLTGSDPDGDPLSFTVVSGPSNGSLTGSDSNLTYNPDPDFNGSDSFTFLVNDGTSNSSTATVDITVTAVNDSPVADDQGVTTEEDTAVSITLTANDVDGDSLTYSVVVGPANGTLSGSAPSLTYTPDVNYNGSDSFTFTVHDGSVDSNTAKVDIAISTVNDSPVADDLTVTTDEDTAVAISLTGSDVDGDELTYSVLTFPANGSLSGTMPDLTYSPNANFNGLDSFNFNVDDGNGKNDTATVTITVTAVNDPPVANPQALSTAEDTPVGITLTASDVDGDDLTYSVVTGSAHGALSGTAPNMIYTPGANYNGPDSFTFEVNDGSVASNIATVDITVTAAASVVDAVASGEIFVAGTVSGDYTNTHEDDGPREAITERDSGGKPIRRFSYLEHKWTFEVTPGNAVTLYANAWSSVSSDGDSFVFAYSTDDANYTNMFTVANTSDAGYVAYGLPASIQGTVYVRVSDSDQTAGNRDQDTVFVDHLYISSETQPGDPPIAPTGLNIIADSASQIDLAWIDNSDDEFGFKIERSLDGSSWSEIATVGANDTSYSDMNLSPNTTYYYQVRAYNSSGSSGYSNVASTTTPDGLSLEANGYKIKGKHTVDLAWGGGSISAVDIYRDGSEIAGANLDFAYTDQTNNKGGGSYLYQVCESGSSTNCSNTVQVDF